MGLRVKLLGQFQVYRDGNPIPQREWRTEKNKDVLKILALYPDQTLPRDWIMESLWPEQDPERSVRNLRGRISETRRILEPHLGLGSKSAYIKTVSDGYALATDDCRIDTQAFRRAYDHAITQAELDAPTAIDSFKRAIEVYIGDLLPADRHKEWTFGSRAELRRLYMDALRQLTELLYLDAQYDQAIRYGEQTLQADPYDERIYRTLMRAHHEMNNVHAAMQLYERCRRTLADRDMDPSEQTHHLAASLRSSAHRHYEQVSMEAELRNLEERMALEHSAEARWDLMGQQLDLLYGLGHRTEEARVLEAAEDLARHLADPGKLGRVFIKWAEYDRALGDWEACDRRAQQAYQQFKAAGDPVGLAEVLLVLGWARLERLDDAGGRERCEQALSQIRLMEGYRVDQLRVRIWHCLGRLATRDEPFDEALGYYDQALRLCQFIEEDAQQARLHLDIGDLHYCRDHVAQARLHWDQGRQIAQRIGNQAIEAECLTNLAVLKTSQADLAEAWRILDRVIDLQERLPENEGLAKSWRKLGTIHTALGQANDALAAFERSRTYSRKADSDLGVAIADMGIASAHISHARLDEAQQRLQAALATFQSHGTAWYEIQARIYLGELDLARGRPTDAKRQWDNARRLAQRLGSHKLGEHTQAALAEAERELGRDGEALAWARIVEAALPQTPPDLDDARVCYRLYRVFHGSGMTDRARPHLRKAYELISDLARQLPDASNWDALKRVPLYREIMAAYENTT
ncbi:MAG: tetratricopeptide repeat protein [Candidatus Bipolaricaulia bacterium]